MNIPNINPADLTIALGATPGNLTPTGTATFRATRTVLQAVVAQLQAPQAQVQVPGNVPPPRVGGVLMSNNVATAWVGGGTGAAALQVPASAKAYRSQDLSLKLKTEKACMIGLSEARRLPPPGSMDVKDFHSVISLSDWIRGLSSALKECGLDTVFRADINGTEVYLLDKWGKATREIVNAHVEALRVLNDPYDMENLMMSGKFLLNSLDDEMLKRTEQELGQTGTEEVTGPSVFAAVIALHSVLNDSTERQFVEKLQKLKLKNEPGEDVSVFANKVLAIAHHITGLSETGVRDLHTLIYTAFNESSTPTFATAVSNLVSRCFLDTATPANRLADWEHQVGALKSLYRDLKSRNEWLALKNVKESIEAQGLVGTTVPATTQTSDVATLQAEVQRLTRLIGASSSTPKQVICHTCNLPGHISPNCPSKTQSTSTTTSVDNNSFKLRSAPKDGAPHVKSHEGRTYKWCATCRRWNHGDKAHLTSEHVKKDKVVVSNLAETEIDPEEEVEVMATLTRVAGYLTVPVDQPVLPIKPVYSRNHHYLTGTSPSDRWCLEDIQGCSSSNPGAVYCAICRQYSTNPDHKYLLVHANNLYLFLEHEARTQSKSQVVDSSMTPITTEEEAEAAVAADLAKWLIVEYNGNSHCRHCNVTVHDWREHENTKSHFQTRLLNDMHDHFATNRFSPLIVPDDEDVVSEEALDDEDVASEEVLGVVSEEALGADVASEEAIGVVPEEGLSLKECTGRR